MADQTKAEEVDEVQPHDNTILTMPVEVQQEVDPRTNNEATDATTAALSKKKKRKSLSLEDRGYRRSGKWSYQEEQYTSELMVNIANGSIPLPPGKSIRGFIAEKLECDPMRVSKKFPGTRELTKQILQKQLEYASTPPSLDRGFVKTFPSPPAVTAPSMTSHHIASTVHQHPVSEQIYHRQVKNTKNRPQQPHQDTTTLLPQALPAQPGHSNPSNNLGSFPKTNPAQLFQLIEHQLMLLQASLGLRPMHHTPWMLPNNHTHPHLHHHTMAVPNNNTTIPKQQAVIPQSDDNDENSRAHKRRYTTTTTDTTTP